MRNLKREHKQLETSFRKKRETFVPGATLFLLSVLLIVFQLSVERFDWSHELWQSPYGLAFGLMPAAGFLVSATFLAITLFSKTNLWKKIISVSILVLEIVYLVSFFQGPG